MKNRKYLCRVLISILLFVFIAGYLLMFFWPGVWYGDVFLYKKSDNVYAGSTLSQGYTIQRIPTSEGADFIFSVEDKTQQYRILNGAPLQIYENDALVYEGTAVYDGDQYILKATDGNLMEIGTSGVIMVAEDGFPTCSQLVNWSFRERDSIRGNLIIFCILIAVMVLLSLTYILPGLIKSASIKKYLHSVLWIVILILVPLSFLVH